MTGGPSQVDLWDPKPALMKYAGQRPGDGGPAHRADDRRTDADEVRVRQARQGRHRDERAAAEPGDGGRRTVRHPLDVHDEPEPRAGAQHVPSGQHDSVAPVDGLVDFVRPRHREQEPAGVHGAGAGRRRVHHVRIPAGRVPGHVVQHVRNGARQDDPVPAQHRAHHRRAARAARFGAGAQPEAPGELRPGRVPRRAHRVDGSRRSRCSSRPWIRSTS